MKETKIEDLNDQITKIEEQLFNFENLKNFNFEVPVSKSNISEIEKRVPDKRVIDKLKNISNPSIKPLIQDMLVKIEQEINFNKYDQAFELLCKSISLLENCDN